MTMNTFLQHLLGLQSTPLQLLSVTILQPVHSSAHLVFLQVHVHTPLLCMLLMMQPVTVMGLYGLYRIVIES